MQPAQTYELHCLDSVNLPMLVLQRITAAYDVIKDPFKRILHDMEIRRKTKPGSGIAGSANHVPSPSPSPASTPYKREPTDAYATSYSPGFEDPMDDVDDGDFDDSVDDWMEHADDPDIDGDGLVRVTLFLFFCVLRMPTVSKETVARKWVTLFALCYSKVIREVECL